ncbi:MAG TPA: GDSL-type esterase/lipase family protein [Candidatus Saccharimonadales bacterium]|nr:GDSL-type esterase/lipase family protein [Candidatus Saccharimonadales bacterium]
MKLLAGAPSDLSNYYGTYEWDRYLFYRFRPGVEVPLTDALAPPGIRPRTRWVLRTNRAGFPGPYVAPGAHPGIYRILCMGDSSTFGWGVEPEDAYPERLRAELERRHPGARIEVVNMGVCGYSSFQGRILLKREGLAYQPDLITISYGSNDWSRVPEPFDEAYERNAGWTGAVRALLHHSRAYQVYAALLTRAVSGEWHERVKEAGVDRAETMPLNVGPEKSEANIRAMIRMSREAGAEPVVVTNCVRDQMAEPVDQAAEAERAPLVRTEDLLASWIPRVPRSTALSAPLARVISVYGKALVDEHPDLEVYLADGCHPNVVGHRILAEALADQVEASPSFRKFLHR